MKFEAELRGMYHRLRDPINPAPAMALINIMAGGQELKLIREPGNEYDSNAIQVWLEVGPFMQTNPVLQNAETREGFAQVLGGFGWDLEMLEAMPEAMLGYVGKEFAEHIAPELDAGRLYEAKFKVSGKGKPLIVVEFPSNSN